MAWAGETTTVYEKGTTGNAWESTDVSEFTVNGSTLSYSETVGMTFNAVTSNSSFYARKTFNHTAKTIVTVDALWNGYSNTSAGYTQGAYFSFGNIFVYQNDQDQKSGYGFGGMGNTAAGTFSHGTYRSGTSPTYHIQFTIDTSTNTLASFTVKSEDDATTWVDVSDVTLSSYDYTTLEFGFNKTTRTQNAKTSSLISIKITETTQDVTTAGYTVQYKCGDTTVKDAVTNRVGVVGNTVSLTDADKASVITDDYKYVYSSDNASSMTIAEDGSTVITVNFNQYEKHNYSFVTNLGETLASGTSFYGEKVGMRHPRYQVKDGELYSKTASYDSNRDYYISFVMPDEDHEETVTYIDTEKDGIVYYQEAEDIEGLTSGTGNSTRASAGKSASGNVTDLAVTTLVPGKYIIYAATCGGANNNQASFILTLGVNTVSIETTGSFNENTSSEITLYETTNVTLTSSNTSTNKTLDYIVIQKVADAVLDAVIDCETYETSSDFKTYIEAKYSNGDFSTAADVYAAHTAWQVENATVTDGKLDITKVIRNAAIADATDWDGASILSGEKYTGAPDDYYLDKNTGTIDASQIIYDLPAGNYVLKAATRSKVGTSGNIYVYADNQVNTNTNINADGNTGGALDRGWSWTEVTFALTEKADVKIGFWANTTNYWASCDDWHIYKVESAKSLNAKGYSTFSSSLNLQVTGADAYTAQLNTEKGEITCKKIADGKIPAGSGVLLFGTENAEVTFTVIENAPALSDNDLKATTLADGTLAPMGNNTYYVLNGNTFMSYTGSAFVPGKAYFDPSGTQARSLTMTFENEMTGIGNVQESKDSKADGCYNLAGQRVSNPTKGLYIMNGKKYIVK